MKPSASHLLEPASLGRTEFLVKGTGLSHIFQKLLWNLQFPLESSFSLAYY